MTWNSLLMSDCGSLRSRSISWGLIGVGILEKSVEVSWALDSKVLPIKDIPAIVTAVVCSKVAETALSLPHRNQSVS